MSNEKQCLCCGETFTPTCHQTRQKFCCTGCRVKYHNAKRYHGVPVNICPECGDTVEQTDEAGRWRRFCSDQCRGEYNRRKAKERRQNRPTPVQMCPNCGKGFESAWTPGTQRRFCCDACRISWWQAYHKANPNESEPGAHCLTCGQMLSGTHHGGKYCSRSCYLQAMEQTHCERVCPWCAEAFSTYKGNDQTYCSRGCAVAARHAPKGIHRIKRWPKDRDAELWRDRLRAYTRENGQTNRGQRVRLVCGDTDMHTGLDGLVAIIRYRLRCNPYDGSLYVFRGQNGAMLKYVEWDGSGFLLGKRCAQRGSYPWPTGEAGTVVEINEREFEYLLHKAIPAPKKKNRKKKRKNC